MAYHKVEVEFNGQPLTIETGKVARQADGAVIVPTEIQKFSVRLFLQENA